MEQANDNLTIEQKREWATVLYTKERVSGKEIATRVGVHINTITAWKEKYNWDLLKKSMLITKEEQLLNIYDQLEALNAQIKTRPNKYPDSKEADTINKLTSSIRSLETETRISEVIDTGRVFIDFLRKDDLEKAKEITLLYDAFIQNILGGRR